MKKYFLLLAFFSFYWTSSEAQEYDPFIKAGSFWDVYTRDANGFCDYNRRRYQVSSDTLINSRNYKKLQLFTIQGDPHPDWPDICVIPPYFIEPDDYLFEEKYIYEDADNQKVYIWARDIPNSDDFKEFTLYDFDVEAGDIIENSYFNFGDDMEVTAVETNTEGRKQITVLSAINYYVEGIGSYEGVFENEITLGSGISHGLFCWGDDLNQNDCAPVLSTTDETLAVIKIFPNPAHDKVFITNLSNGSIKLYSILGKEMAFQFSEENQSIDISHLKNGIYFLEILKNSHQKQVLKIVKN
jgi:hypothetical protein